MFSSISNTAVAITGPGGAIPTRAARAAGLRRFALMLVLLIAGACFSAFGRPDGEEPEAGAPPFEETSVFVNVQRVGGREFPAAIRNGQVYLPVADVFEFLKIRNVVSAGADSVSGYFVDPRAAFVIDGAHQRIRYEDRLLQLEPDALLHGDNGLYLKLPYFGQVFGLECSFDFRNLSVKMNPATELPVIREMMQEQARRNVCRLQGEETADTTIGRTRPAFNLGSVEWSVITMQEGERRNDTRASLGLGGVIAGGETNIVLNYFSHAPLGHRQQFYQWRYVDNDRRALRQVLLGRINPQSTSSIFVPVTGAQITNTPTTIRRSFGTYALSDVTQPGWLVELYINNVLVDFKRADAAGFFSFDVPMVYGNTDVLLRYYSPWGEEYSRRKSLYIPFNFVPKGELEYTLSAGLVEDGRGSRYSRLSMNYGLGRGITISSGAEYLSSVSSGSFMPYAQASFRLAPGLLASAEYTHGVRARGILNYRLSGGLQLELNYTRYAEGQRAIIYNFLEERRASVSVPFRCGGASFMSRLSLNQMVLPGDSKYTNGEWLLTGGFGRVNASLNTFLVAVEQAEAPGFDPYVYSNAALALRLPGGFLLTPQVQYAYRQRELISVRCGLERMVFRKGFFNLTYEQNFKSGINSLGAGFRFDLSFARVGASARSVNSSYALVQSASGAVVLDAATAYARGDNRSSMGRAGIALLAFLDVNGNGRRDEGEPKLPGLRVQVAGGYPQYSEKDTLIRILSLEPYTRYHLVLGNGFENMAWQMAVRTLNVVTDANLVKLVEIPVSVAAEVSGRVWLQDGAGRKGLGRIHLDFYTPDGERVAGTTSEQDGYFSLLGLPAGRYLVRTDGAQLQKLQLKATGPEIMLNIAPSVDGTVVEGLEFVLEAAAGGK